MAAHDILNRLLSSSEPSVRFKVQTRVLGKALDSPEIVELREQIRNSSRVKRLLSERDKPGRIPTNPYSKWRGAHWVLADLADLGYPPGDETLTPLRDQVYEWLFSKRHETEHLKVIAGKVRRCASQEGNALYSSLALGLMDDRTDELAARLTKWQWPDGGWNCDKDPNASNSSFMESLIPLRALSLHAKLKGTASSEAAAKRASEIFLKRSMYRRQRDGRIMNKNFTLLHYPCYWHYDILFGLKVMAKAGLIRDDRCEPALNLLTSKRLPDGGFPAEAKYYHVTDRSRSGFSLVDWGGVSKRHYNEFVTADALFVLKEAGRIG